MSKHHDRIKNDPRWKAVRAACLERDGYACVECGSTEQLQADHILELALHPDLAFELDNLQTLCQPCHEEKGKTGNAKQEINRMQWVNPKYEKELTGIL